MRAFGASEYVALLAVIVLSGIRVVYGVVKSRRLEPFAVYLLPTFGLSLAVGLATTDPKLILVGNTLVNGIGGLLVEVAIRLAVIANFSVEVATAT